MWEWHTYMYRWEYTRGYCYRKKTLPKSQVISPLQLNIYTWVLEDFEVLFPKGKRIILSWCLNMTRVVFILHCNGNAVVGNILLIFTIGLLRLVDFTGSLALADPRGAPGTRPPPRGSKFFHFHAVFGKKLKNNSTFGSWRPPRRKSWIRHWLVSWVKYTFICFCQCLESMFMLLKCGQRKTEQM